MYQTEMNRYTHSHIGRVVCYGPKEPFPREAPFVVLTHINTQISMHTHCIIWVKPSFDFSSSSPLVFHWNRPSTLQSCIGPFPSHKYLYIIYYHNCLLVNRSFDHYITLCNHYQTHNLLPALMPEKLWIISMMTHSFIIFFSHCFFFEIIFFVLEILGILDFF